MTNITNKISRITEIYNYFLICKVTKMSEKRQFHQIPGQYEFDGIIFGRIIEPETLHRIKTSFIFKDDDLLLLTYPKSGKQVSTKKSGIASLWGYFNMFMHDIGHIYFYGSPLWLYMTEDNMFIKLLCAK